MTCYFVPPHITRRLPLPNRAADLAHDQMLRQGRRQVVLTPKHLASVPTINVFDAHNREETSSTTIRDNDVQAEQAAEGLTAVYELGLTVNVQVSPMTAFVHYGQDYDNAFWDGQEMCFGDGDGQYLGDFTKPVDVCAHERWHGVTGDKLAYEGQAGALNESMSDIAGIVAKQRTLHLSVQVRESWLIGQGLLLEHAGITRGLRDMLSPGSAYDTAALGRDPQPMTMAGYVDTTDDDGGVHINSSIPSRAFALAAVKLGDTSALFALWVDVLLKASYPTDCTFAQWAQLTVDRAPNPTVQAAVATAWASVGIRVRTPMPAPAPTPAPAPVPAPSSDVDAVLAGALQRALSARFCRLPGYLRTAAQAWLEQR